MSNRSISEQINTWVQTLGIIVAGIWAASIFLYKEYNEPANITAHLELKKIGAYPLKTNGQSTSVLIVEMKASIKNPSSRRVELLPSVWAAYGRDVEYDQNRDDKSFIYMADSALAKPLGIMERGFTGKHRTLLSTGRLFTDWYLDPNEESEQTQILRIPSNTFEELDVDAFFPTAVHKNALDMKWSIDSIRIKPTLLHFGNEVDTSKVDAFREKPYVYQYLTTRNQLYLR
ncbi:MAG TPA: hypothetical protein VMF88_10575 [Bacteroidota bacterium]|nr:hypothetical protein [Bacteroidota bacterium]